MAEGVPSLLPADVVRPATWSNWESEGTPIASDHRRQSATAVIGDDVLITGGFVATDYAGDGGHPELALAATRRASSGEWRATAPMNEGRRGHTATTLLDGRVLCAGSAGYQMGMTTLEPRADTESYLPSEDRWVRTAPMNQGRVFHSATLLQDGRVLVTGGGGYDSTLGKVATLASAELYDPATDHWEASGTMWFRRLAHGSVTLPSGDVLVVGEESAEVFRISTERFEFGAFLPHPSSFPAVLAQTADGNVVAMGAPVHSEAGDSTPILRFDWKSEAWSAGPMLPLDVLMPALTSLPDGTLIVAGGEDSGGRSLRRAFILAPGSNQWRELPSPQFARSQGTLHALTTGLLLTGGYISTNGSAVLPSEVLPWP